MSVPPPGMDQERWVRLLAGCRQMDDRYNRAESVGKPRLTSDSDPKQVFVSDSVTPENRVLPAPLPTAGELADTYKEAST